MVAIVDYGVGNLFSLGSSFAAIGEEACVTSDPAELCRADRVVLPGVGAFGDAAEKLKKQKHIVQGYVMDEVFDKMEAGDALIAPYYAGDALTILEGNEPLISKKRAGGNE